MTRLSILVLAFAVAACDTGAPASGASGAVPLASISSKSSENVHPISETMAVETAGKYVVLHIDGQRIEMSAADAYSVGAALSRVGYDAFPSEEAALVFPPPKGGDKCNERPFFATDSRSQTAKAEFVTAFAVRGQIVLKCPPPPPPDFNVGPDVWKPFVPESVRPVEVPRDLDWHKIPGGFIADMPR